jgi:site-specific recombinase XerD
MADDDISWHFDGDNAAWYSRVDAFLDKFKSPHTRRAYTSAITSLEKWVQDKHISMELLSRWEAQTFVEHLEVKRLAFSSIRRDVAALSGFYAFMLKESVVPYNPFDRILIKAEEPPKQPLIIPDPDEINLILDEVPPIEKAIIQTIINTGFYSGTLPTLEQQGDYYIGICKGKPLVEAGKPGIVLPPVVIAAIKAGGLDEKRPFADFSATAIERRINNHVSQLHGAGLIRAAYSCLGFRNYFAVQEFTTNRDIYRLSKMLGHTALQTTQNYLWRLGMDA